MSELSRPLRAFARPRGAWHNAVPRDGTQPPEWTQRLPAAAPARFSLHEKALLRRHRLLRAAAAHLQLRRVPDRGRSLLLDVGPAPRALLLRPPAAAGLAAGAVAPALRAQPLRAPLDDARVPRDQPLDIPSSSRRRLGRRGVAAVLPRERTRSISRRRSMASLPPRRSTTICSSRSCWRRATAFSSSSPMSRRGQRGRTRDLMLAAVLLGLATLTKYNGAFLGIAVAGTVLVRPKLRPAAARLADLRGGAARRRDAGAGDHLEHAAGLCLVRLSAGQPARRERVHADSVSAA